MAATAPAKRKIETSSRGFEMPTASAATSASRTATSARPCRLFATFSVIQVQRDAAARQRAKKPSRLSKGAGISGPAMPMPPPVTSCQASAIWVTIVAKPSVVMAK